MIEFIKKNGPSFVGHIVEGQVLALITCLVAVYGFGWAWGQSYALFGFLVPWLFYYGREKRDCENALDLNAGDIKAYWLLWTRPSNVSDLVGNPIVYAIVMAIKGA